MRAQRESVTGIRRPASGIDIDTERLVRLRQSKSWERADLAREAKVSPSMISKIEKRERRPRARMLGKICTALGCDVEELLA